ncbi:MAG: 5-bromo-4-chloroindolyl phosphate hydrolysis family protein [Firmicutes bacterium]|nr:5-bromo-4-chloroindolyl phosphate hydrolysis family protein [Bacillota bacterium]
MNDNDLNDLFRQIGKTVQDIASPENIAELKKSIDETVRDVKDAVKQSAAANRAASPAPPPLRPQAAPAAPPRPAKAAAVPSAPPKTEEKTLAIPPNRVPGHAAGPLLTVAGAGGILFSAAAIGHLLISSASLAITAELITYAALMALSAFAAAHGTALRLRVRRYRTYLHEISGAAFCSIRTLASSAGKTAGYVLRDIKKMIRRGYFPQGHLDEQGTCLMLDDKTFKQYQELMTRAKEKEAYEKERQEQLRSNPELESVIREGKQCLGQIREANEAIPGEEISRKLSRLESVTEKIFEYVAQHPEKLPEIRRFMSYYLPTTLKLVNAYRKFDAQPVQGENILSSKREIEDTLDTINLAFENLFDGLFEDDAMDVSTDISVLETMLRQEGLTGSDFKRS